MSVAILIAAPLLLLIALAVRFAGSAKILNVVDYSKVRDAQALHVWAGNRLILLALTTAALGGAFLASPTFSFLYLAGFIVVVLLVVIWLAVGASKFRVGAN